jgi:hypothetical protein
MRNSETRMANRLYLDEFAFNEPSHLLRWCARLADLFSEMISDGRNRASAKPFVLNLRDLIELWDPLDVGDVNRPRVFV